MGSVPYRVFWTDRNTYSKRSIDWPEVPTATVVCETIRKHLENLGDLPRMKFFQVEWDGHTYTGWPT